MSSSPDRDTRVLLREPRDDDVGFLRDLRNDAQVQRAAMALARGSTLGDVRTWVERRRSDPATLLRIVADAEARPLGYAQLTGIVREQGSAWLGICLAPEHQGKGIGELAVGLLEWHAREALGIRKILLEVLHSNGPARRLYEKLGYREVGTLRSHFRDEGGGAEDAVLMEKLL